METNLKEKLWSWEELEETLKDRYEDPDIISVRLAFDYASEAHAGKKRYTGAPYIIHPTATAIRLAQMQLPLAVVIAGLLHDVPEDTDRTIEDVEAEFGADIAKIVSGVTKLGKVKYRGIERYAENLRKMFLAMAADVRVVFVKFADRLHNVETLFAMPEAKRSRVAKEVLEIYAPIASRLGMGDMKGRLEDNAFKYAFPKEYKEAVSLLDQNVQVREGDIDKTIDKAKTVLESDGVKIEQVKGRRKFVFSFWRKLKRYHGDLSKIYDIVAIRVVVKDVADCYAVLGTLHSHWPPLKGRIKDYIAQPKPNGYQSLHTTVFDETCGIVEFQIRTHEMHEQAEYGVAAHWNYKQEGSEKKFDTMPWMEDLVDIHKEISAGEDFLTHLEEVKLDMFQDRIFVLTPEGDVIDLPEYSTPVDFAYAIHTEVGNQTVNAHVNDQAVPLDTILKSGDMVSITTNKSRKGPNPEWLKFVKTNQAQTKIRAATKSKVKQWIETMSRKK
ncbi:bifunctional (p)ppGpp synthetase/guanosine-3',5'-bis(diphosphate) 3'-pyrophosphohydrolase [Candidatus Uhrbacteria bacterium]|jgi:GTP diphosphokinase / guanosine-3',5'-bis(diphosphate) 3'-diphosphatase|nr:bifunctional (p)ppGpp synthetase/guanosine-3',5'-bis(diphosphate) 3'-pyrophosphohydrolase [Candidatus Uhrbacteria bacterium]